MKSFIQASLPEKYNLFSGFAKTFWPGLDSLSTQRRLIGAGDVFTVLYTIPLALIGMVWLVYSTDLALILNNFIFLVFNFCLLVLFSKLSFFTIVQIRTDRYGSSEDSFASMIQWAAVFLLGPSALWMSVIYNTAEFIMNWRNSPSEIRRWSLLRTLTVAIAVNTFAFLVGIQIFELVGGTFPLLDLSLITIEQGFIALLSEFIVVLFIISGYLLYHLGVQKILAEDEDIKPMVRFFLIAIFLPYLSHPFSILLAGLLVDHGYAVYIFLLMGLIMVAYLARRLSFTAEKNRQQSNQLEKLERLGRDLLEVIPAVESLPEILEKNIPGMFPSGRISIRISPNNTLLNFPPDWEGLQDNAWEWILEENRPRSFTAKEDLPWDPGGPEHLATAVTQIRQSDSGRAIGGIVLELRALAQSWDKKTLRNLFPALQALADQISSTIQQTEVYEQSLDFQQISQELKLAGQIQASFLPNVLPSIEGWQLAVTLLPARETSGDFFDLFELSEGRLGILVADVADKGVGSALYMALSRTLIRTYAEEYDAEPDVVFYAANNRLLKDARANLFVTSFYGILDPVAGRLIYSNAGQNPPILFRASNDMEIVLLQRTGTAIGITENSTWSMETIDITPGDVLLLYTDGIPDAQDKDGDFFDDDRIIDITQANSGKFAHEIQAEIVEEVQKFSGNAPQTDDITLMVLKRNENSN